MKELTQKQSETLQFIMDHVVEHGYPPTVREIGTEFKITPKGALDRVIALQKKGHVVSEAKQRGIKILKDPDGNKVGLKWTKIK
jgi:repressor LexA